MEARLYELALQSSVEVEVLLELCQLQVLLRQSSAPVQLLSSRLARGELEWWQLEVVQLSSMEKLQW